MKPFATAFVLMVAGILIIGATDAPPKQVIASPAPPDNSAELAALRAENADLRQQLSSPASPVVDTVAAPIPAVDSFSPLQQEMLSHSNAIRLAANKPSQTIDDKLCAMAQEHADFLARNRISIGVPAHALNGGVDGRARRHGFSGRVGENIAGDFSTAENAFVLGWGKSADHQKTIISDEYDLCGFGHKKDSQGLNYWVAVYGQQTLANRHYFVPSVDTPTLCHVCGENVYHKIHPWKNVSQEAATETAGAIDPRVKPPGPVQYVRSEQMPADVPGHVWIPGRPGTRLEGFWVLYQVNVELFNCPTCKGSGIFRGAVCPSCDGAANAAKPKFHQQVPNHFVGVSKMVSNSAGGACAGTSGPVAVRRQPQYVQAPKQNQYTSRRGGGGWRPGKFVAKVIGK